MDELLIYLQGYYYCHDELERILDTRIMINENHIKNIKGLFCEFDIIKIFEKYGYVFTDETYKIIIKNCPYLLKYIPENIQTNEFYEYMVQVNGFVLQYIPINKKTAKICKLAVQQAGFAFIYVPDGKRTNELCKLYKKASKQYEYDIMIGTQFSTNDK